MPDFNPAPNDSISLGGQEFTVMPHPSVPAFAFGQEGRKAFVYQLASAAQPDQMWAIKIFKQAYRVPELLEVCRRLERFAAWPGMEVCQRTCLHRGRHDDVLDRYPEMEYAVLMPWIIGSTWYDVLIGSKPLTRLGSVTFAASTARVLAALEEAGVAHCDIAAPNVIISEATGQTHLIDVEDMYAAGFEPPAALPAGTEGYAHQTAAEGLWNPQADRFAGAVLMAEMAAWHLPEIRKQADEEHFFAGDEMQQDVPRFHQMRAALAGITPHLAELFEAAWFSPTLRDAPPLAAWHDVLQEAARAERLGKVVSGWQPLGIPSGAASEAPDLAQAANDDSAFDDHEQIEEEPPLRPGALFAPEPAPPAPASAPPPPVMPPSLPPAPRPPAVGQPGPAAEGPIREWRPLSVPPPSAPPSGPAPAPRPVIEMRPLQPPSPPSAELQQPPLPPDIFEPETESPGPAAPTLRRPLLDLSHIDQRNRPHLVWSESFGATHYLLQEAQSADFDRPREFRLKAGDTRWHPQMGRSGRLFYRIRAEAGDDFSPWSDALNLRIGEG